MKGESADCARCGAITWHAVNGSASPMPHFHARLGSTDASCGCSQEQPTDEWSAQSLALCNAPFCTMGEWPFDLQHVSLQSKAMSCTGKSKHSSSLWPGLVNSRPLSCVLQGSHLGVQAAPGEQGPPRAGQAEQGKGVVGVGSQLHLQRGLVPPAGATPHARGGL